MDNHLKLADLGRSSSLHFELKNIFKGEWTILVSATFEEFVLELDPMKSQAMEEAFQYIHEQQYKQSE